MKYVLIILLYTALVLEVSAKHQPAPDYPDTLTIQLVRSFSKDLFDANAVSIMQPSVEVINATSNDRFFTKAYVPKKVKKPYFRFSVQTMTGFVPESMKTFSPNVPAEKFDLAKALQFVDPITGEVSDSAGLINYFFKTILYDAVDSGDVIIPDKAATLLGSGQEDMHLDSEVLIKHARNNPLWDNPLLDSSMKQRIESTLRALPGSFPLSASGSEMNTLFAFVPQIEIGSLFGTELMLRYIPKLNYGEKIGDFGFWGFALKHSISQYFYEEDDPEAFQLAIQFGLQGTSLENTIGVTETELKSEASLMNVNIHGSKSIENWFDIWGGLSYETIEIKTSYLYYINISTQEEIRMTEYGSQLNNDHVPQLYESTLSDKIFKFSLGLQKDIGPIGIFAGFSLSEKINMFTGGVSYTL